MAMSLGTSPRLLPPAEISGDAQPHEDQKRSFCTELPVRTQVSPPSTFPQPKTETSSMTGNRTFPPSESYYTKQAAMDLDAELLQWPAQGRYAQHNFAPDATTFCTPTHFAQNPACIGYPQPVQNAMSYNDNSAFRYQTHYQRSCPRIYNGNDLTGLPSDVTASYPPATFFHTPPHVHKPPSLPDTSTPELIQLSDDYEHNYSAQLPRQEQFRFNSPYSNMSRASTPYSIGHEEDNPIDKEQPYAQLIYRALLDAPEHTMVLRDIYDWFRRYTDKATHSETKGWQNSIRHNLSMNGAFEKVDSPSDTTTKGFMWRLTTAALREGVKSTTRYRSKAPNKRSSSRTQPLPQRQASGSKGGHAARRAANLRRSQRAREALYRSDPRSEPYTSLGTQWDDPSLYSPDPSFPSPVDTPYSTYQGSDMAFSPYHAATDNDAFRPMHGMSSHLISPPRSYASTPTMPNTPVSQPGWMGADAAYVLEQAPGEPLFGASPTPSADEPITPIEGHGGWVQDIAMGIDVYDELAFGGSV